VAPTSTIAPTSAPAATGQTLTAADINDRARSAVVQITNNQKQQSPFGTSSFQVPAGVGTGFIFDKRGYILTNNHVVEGANSIVVTTTDNKTFDAKLVGRYPLGDLAVIQITGNGDLPTVPLGDSGKLRVGDPVVAIGNALALPGGPTVTMGVVSALGRVQQEPNNGPQPGAFLVDLIQTDAAINPGNSGGPLFNLQGQVVGINTLGVTQAEQGVPAQGINFAISINSAKPVADALIAGTPIPRPFLGISSDSLSPVQDAQLGLPANTGIGVAAVTPGSAAAKAGIRPNDIILKIDGQTIQGEEGFVGYLLKHKPGDTITLTILRNKQQQDVQVTLDQAPTS
jgi:S1-C subfamily serine protease